MFELFRFTDAVAAFTKKMRGIEDECRFRSDVLLEIRDAAGKLKHRSFQKNLRTTVGVAFWEQQLFGTGSPTSTLLANRIALTNTGGFTPVIGDTVLSGELVANGLQRTGVLTPTSANPAVFTNTFTYTGSGAVTVTGCGLFTDTHSNGGTLVLETAFASSGTVSTNGDTISVTWTITF